MTMCSPPYLRSVTDHLGQQIGRRPDRRRIDDGISVRVRGVIDAEAVSDQIIENIPPLCESVRLCSVSLKPLMPYVLQVLCRVGALARTSGNQ